YAFTRSVHGVLLEGLEVAFIVVTFGSSEQNIPLAALAAAAALLLVVGAGFALRAPLARVPESAIKFSVGVLLTTFGTFWGAEGTGVSWPGDELALPAIVAFIALSSLALVKLLERRRVRIPAEAPA